MGEYFPNQRYTSDGEPELGVGLVKEVSKGKVQVYFPVSDETRLYTVENAPLRRVIFKVGDTVVDSKGKSILIEHIELVDTLYMYYGKNIELSEAEIGSMTISHNVDDRLLSGEIDTPEMFALRRETLMLNYKRKISPVHGFVGGKIDLIPHQLYIAHEVSSRYAPRVLLSDQVGLGKTIEACLILHRLLLSGRISRVLILVPESLIHQWFVEVLRRFNLWFNIYDEKRCSSLEKGAPEGNPFLDDQLIICSIEFLAGLRKRTKQAISASWDMLVVDEAHHLEWSLSKVSPEYKSVESLSKVAKGLLLLTATPEQLGVESHFARLHLLDPNRYAHYNDFVSESSDNKDIASIVEKLSTEEKLPAADIKLLESIFPKKRIALLAKKDETARHNLIEDLLDQHGPGRVLFRNTRLAMSGFPKRIAHVVPLESTEDHSIWLERLTQEFTADIEGSSNTKGEQEFWFDKDPRVIWLLKKMEELYPAKILLICTTKKKVLALEAVLKELANMKAGIFHEDLTLIQRDRNSAWFADNDDAQILLCSEIGSEGRNFQFAHHLVLFDMPMHPELLEQRIGRLDRIGQTEDIHIHIPYLVGSPQQMMIRWYHEGLNAFNTNLEDGNILSELYRERLLSIISTLSNKNAESELNALIAETFSFHEELKKNLAEGRDKLLEMNSFRPKVAEKLIEQIQAEDDDSTLEIYLKKVFHHFDMEMQDLAARTYLIHPSSINSAVFPSISREGIRVTFDRKRALSREDVSFLSWDHPITTGAIDMVLSTVAGSASFGVIRGTGGPALLLELLFVLETAGEQTMYVDRFLPNTPIRVVIDHSGKEVTDLYSAEMLNVKIKAADIEPLLENETLANTLLPNMVASATNIAEGLCATEIANGLQRMNTALNHEIDRLTALQKKNKHVRPEEVQIAKDEQKALTKTIKNARLRLDALMLIRKE